MSRSNKILIGVLALQVVLALVLLTRSSETSIGSLQPLLADFSVDDIQRIEVHGQRGGDNAVSAGGDDKPAIVLERHEGGWIVGNHFGYPTRSKAVEELLDKLAAMRSRGPLASGAGRERQLEVNSDVFRRKLVLTTGKKSVTLFIGAGAGARQTSVRFDGYQAIYGVSGLTPASASADVAGWIDTTYFQARPEDIQSFEVANVAGSFAFERNADSWAVSINGNDLAVPAGKELNTDTIDGLLNSVGSIRVAEPADPSRSIETAETTVTIRMKGEAPAVAPGEEAPMTAPEPGPEHILDFATTDKPDRTYVRERGNPLAASADALSVTEVVELTVDKLLRTAGEGAAKAAAEAQAPSGLPPGFDPSQLPPGFDLNQLPQ